MMNRFDYLRQRGNAFWLLIGSLLVFLLGLIDFLTGYKFSFSLFYLAPISLIAWYKSRDFGLGFSIVSAIVWLVADYFSGDPNTDPTTMVWNTLIRMGFFIIVTLLLSALRAAYDNNQTIARVDFVSGAVSVSYFYTIAKNEIERSGRYKKPFTFAYIDLDNFKRVNDTLGHSTGDRLLRAVTENVKRQIRATDIFARLGGDEFALLLPETDEEKAKVVVSRVHSILTENMRKNGWEVTFSIGAVTYRRPPASVDEMVRQADGVMYSVKTASKNGVAYQLYAA